MIQEWSNEHLRLAVDAAQVALWAWDVDTNDFAMDQRSFELWGLPLAESVRFDDLSSNIHPEDRDRVQVAFEATRSVRDAYEIDFRILIDDEIRWISARGQGGDEGLAERRMFGIFLDVTGRKQAEEGNELLAGEMSHRVKNLLTIASSLTYFTSRSSETVEHMTHELTSRLSALGRAHDLVRPLPGSQGNATLLGDVLSVLLSPYEDQGAFSGRTRVSVPRMGVGERAATALAMIIHELATNSAKYGAFSLDTGTLDISGTNDEELLTLTWAESGGPEIAESPPLKGFGSRMVLSNLRQLRGSIEYDWRSTGLVATLTMRLTALNH